MTGSPCRARATYLAISPKLQLLPGLPNIEKQDKPPREWLQTGFASTQARDMYMIQNDLDLLPSDLTGFRTSAHSARNGSTAAQQAARRARGPSRHAGGQQRPVTGHSAAPSGAGSRQAVWALVSQVIQVIWSVAWRLMLRWLG
jgi:hypothetical protein